MIDRAARDEAISAFEDYLDDGITAFEFDDRLQDMDTEDETVNEVVYAAWFHYDDCKDHKVLLSKAEWDYFQRLLLILRSDAEFSATRRWRWSWDHALAWLAAGGFLVAAAFAGWGYQLFAVAIPFGIISILIHRYRLRNEPQPEVRDIACAPFASFSQIRWLRRRVPHFTKRRYRPEVGERVIRGPGELFFSQLVAYPFWFLFSPLALFFQGFPTPEYGRATLTEERETA